MISGFRSQSHQLPMQSNWPSIQTMCLEDLLALFLQRALAECRQPLGPPST